MATEARRRPPAHRLQLAAGCAAFAASFAALIGAATAAKPGAVMSVKDVKPGMKGYAVTVFQGHDTDRFDIEVIDVMPDYQPGMDAVLFTSSDPRMRHTGIVGGMSGSPVYIEGKLLGAVAYGYRFSKDPIGGITPIESMLEIDKLPNRPDIFPKARASGRSGQAAWADQMLGLGASPVPPRRRADEIPDHRGVRSAGLEPLGLPLSISGLGPQATAFLAEHTGMIPVRGGGGAKLDATSPAPKGAKPAFAPGDSISVVLIAGDNGAAPNGTVTWVGGRKNERVLAFGHPMYGNGPSRLPVATARVHTIIPSVERSVKLSSAKNIRGTMIQDRQPAISIRTDIETPMIPVVTKVRGPDPDLPKRQYDSAVARHENLTPALVGALLLDGVEEAGNDAVELVLETRHKISLKTSRGPRTIELREETFFPQGILRGAIARSRVFQLMSAAIDNEYELAEIRSIEQEAVLTYGAPVERIEKVTLVKEEVRAGELVHLDVVLETPRGPRRNKRIALRIPEDAGGHKVLVHLAGGDWVRPRRPIPANVDDLLDNLASSYASRSIIASIYRSDEGLSTKHGLMRSLPGSVLETLSPSGTTRKAVRFKQASRRVISTKTLIEGEHKLEIAVLPAKTNAP
jgi:hypothetical protein